MLEYLRAAGISSNDIGTIDEIASVACLDKFHFLKLFIISCQQRLGRTKGTSCHWTAATLSTMAGK